MQEEKKNNYFVNSSFHLLCLNVSYVNWVKAGFCRLVSILNLINMLVHRLNVLELLLCFSRPIEVIQFISITQSWWTLWDAMDCSVPGFPVHHQLPELAQTHVHGVGDAIQSSHPLLSPSTHPFQPFPASGSFPKSWFFASGGQSIGASASASVLPMNIQDWFPLGLTGWISLLSMGFSRVFSNTTVQKYQFFYAQLSL